MKRPLARRTGRAPRRRRRHVGDHVRKRLKPSADGRLKKVFARIGVPEPKAFTPDPFQCEAVSAVSDADCLVCAPTGSGKTWIAQEAIRRVLGLGKKAWYASPLKALSNSKLVEFGAEFGSRHVGILTGDRKENVDAEIIVGTTEILRNQLYDAMHEGTDLGTDLVILDEAHFLGDRDRGVVWEEVMIYLPQRINLLLLSATIGNAAQIADWLESIRSKRCFVVEENTRPVPLFPLFLHPSGRLLPLVSGGRLDKQVRRFLNSEAPRSLAPPGRLPPFGEILGVLGKFKLLPAIFFMKSRSDCDAALGQCEGQGHTKAPQEVNKAIDDLARGSAYLEDHRQMWHLRNLAVAAHHSGQLPAWKLLVEELMTGGWLKAVFATSTVAAGVNFPARSVVFLNSDRFNGYQFVPLNGTEFHQTTGRAGRRGKDRIGFAVVIPGRYMDAPWMADLFRTGPEDVVSQIRMDFSMALNLLLSHRPDEIQEIFHQSFAAYLAVVNRQPGLEKRVREAGRRLMAILPEALCEGPEAVLSLIRRRKALIWESKTLGRRLKGRRERMAKMGLLEPGRLFLDRRGRTYCVVKRQTGGDEPSVLGLRVKKKPTLGRHRLRLRRFSPNKVSQVLGAVVPLPDIDDRKELRTVIARAARKRPRPVTDLPPLGEMDKAELAALEEALDARQAQIDALLCKSCKHMKRCHGKRDRAFREACDDFSLLWDQKDAVRARLWKDFLRHLAFLKEEGFVQASGRLTPDGLWAARLRLDQPLLVAQALRRKVFSNADPALIAALVAPFAHDRDVEEGMDETKLPQTLLVAYERMRGELAGITKRKAERGFEVRPISIWASASVYAWARGASWEDLVDLTGAPEGDLAMLVMRTAENLRQIGGLKEAFPKIAGRALDAIDLILRAPVAWD